MWIWGRRAQRLCAILITLTQKYIQSIRLITVNVDLEHLAGVVFVLFHLPFFHAAALRRKSLHAAHPEGVVITLHLLRVEYLHKYLKIFHVDHFFTSPCMYLFNYLYQYGLLNFYMSGYTPKYFVFIIQYYFIYFVAESVLGIAFGSSLSRLLCPFDTPISLYFCHCF